MPHLETAAIHCPYCGEQIDVVIDPELFDQDYIEDCSVCCRPITLFVASAHGELASIEARTENE